MTPEHLDAQILSQPSLPKARQWLQWLSYHRAAFPGGAGWIDCLSDVFVELHHCIATSARRLRGNPTWDLSGTMIEDTEKLEDRAQRLLHKVEGINRRDVPTRFEPMLDCLFGAVRQQVRLGREIHRMRELGELRISVLVDQREGTVTEQ